jgi:DNA-binding MarR family transcriptional regulator
MVTALLIAARASSRRPRSARRLTDTGRTVIDQAIADLLAAEAALLDGLTDKTAQH